MFLLYLGDEDGKDGDDDQVFSSREDEIAKVAAKYHKLIGNIKVFLFPKQKKAPIRKKTFFQASGRKCLDIGNEQLRTDFQVYAVHDSCKKIQIYIFVPSSLELAEVIVVETFTQTIIEFFRKLSAAKRGNDAA